MRDFTYRTPQDLAEAVSSLRQSDAEILAGGTELLNWMRLGISAPAALVDIGRIENGFSAIELRGESLLHGIKLPIRRRKPFDCADLAA